MKNFFKIMFLTTCFVFGLGSLSTSALNFQGRDWPALAHFINVGHGDSILLQSEGTNVLVDAGSSSYGGKVVSYLQNQGVRRINAVILTHYHRDHIGGMVDILRNFQVDKVIFPHVIGNKQGYQEWNCYKNMMSEISQRHILHPTVSLGGITHIGNIILNDITPRIRGRWHMNDMSRIFNVQCKGVKILLTGDAGKEETDAIEREYGVDRMRANVLKVPDHGHDHPYSATGNFYQNVGAQYAIVSCKGDVQGTRRFNRMRLSHTGGPNGNDIVCCINGTNLDVVSVPAAIKPISGTKTMRVKKKVRRIDPTGRAMDYVEKDTVHPFVAKFQFDGKWYYITEWSSKRRKEGILESDLEVIEWQNQILLDANADHGLCLSDPKFQCPKGTRWNCHDEVLVHTYHDYVSPIDLGMAGTISSFHARIPMDLILKNKISSMLGVSQAQLPAEFTLTIQDRTTQGTGRIYSPQLQLKPQWCFANRHEIGTTTASTVKADVAILNNTNKFNRLSTMQSKVSLHQAPAAVPYATGIVASGPDAFRLGINLDTDKPIAILSSVLFLDGPISGSKKLSINFLSNKMYNYINTPTTAQYGKKTIGLIFEEMYTKGFVTREQMDLLGIPIS